MRTNARRMVVALALLLVSIPVSARAAEPQERADKATYNRLVQEVKRIDADYSTTIEQAMKEAREDDGKASLETQSRIIALRNERDRVMTRLWMVALRHGWEVPDINASDKKLGEVPTEEEQVFKGAEFVIKARFAEEAARIAGAVALPIVSISDAVPEADDD